LGELNYLLHKKFENKFKDKLKIDVIDVTGFTPYSVFFLKVRGEGPYLWQRRVNAYRKIDGLSIAFNNTFLTMYEDTENVSQRSTR
jgi:hypothetical protein